MDKLPIDLPLADERATAALAGRLASALGALAPQARLLLALQGDLGAGKSTLARALLRALGVDGPVRSPTYTLVEPYELPDGSHVSHLDLYRIGEGSELEFIGYFDERRSSRLMIVEWPERVPAVLGDADLIVHLEPCASQPAARQATLHPQSEVGAVWLSMAQGSHQG